MDGLDNVMHWLDLELPLANKNPIREFGVWGVSFEGGYETLGHAYHRWQIDPMLPYNVGWLMRLYPPQADESIIGYTCRLNDMQSKASVLERGSEYWSGERNQPQSTRRKIKAEADKPVQLRMF